MSQQSWRCRNAGLLLAFILLHKFRGLSSSMKDPLEAKALIIRAKNMTMARLYIL